VKKHWKISAAAALAAVICWCIWYSQPITVFDLKPELEPAVIDIYIQRFGDSSEKNESLIFDVNAATPEGRVLLEQLEVIRIRRSPLNPLRKVLPSTFTGRQTQDGQYNYVIHVFGASGGWIALQIFIDEWAYDLSEQPQYLPCQVSGGKSIAQTLGDELWQMAQQAKSIS